MTTAGEVVATIRAMADDAGSVLMDVAEFFAGLPADLDLASAEHYLHKEFRHNDTGVDDRVQIFTFDPEPTDDEGYWDSSGYDEDDDDYVDDYYCCEDCG